MPRGALLLSITMLLAVVEDGSCLSCYTCISSQRPECVKTPHKSSNGSFVPPIDCKKPNVRTFNEALRNTSILPAIMVDEKIPNYFCVHIVTNADVTVRTCLPGDPFDKHRHCRGLFPHCSYCDEDACNSNEASNLASSGFSIALITISIFVLV